MTSSIIWYIVAFVLYLSFMIVIGWLFMKGNNSSEDFFLGGRKMGPWVTALSAEASDMSGWLLMGLPGLAYLGGMKEAFWTALGLVIGTYLNWLIVAKPLRKCTIAFGNSITITEFFTNRFKDNKRVLATISTLLTLFFFTIYTASGFVACAKLFNSVFGLNYYVGLTIGMVVILSYTVLGGYTAVCVTDFIQGSLMFLALIIVGIVMLVSLGGPTEAFAKVSEFGNAAINGQLGEAMKAKFLGNQNYGAVPIISALVWGLGYFGMPHILVRFMGIRSNKEVALSRRIATVWVIIAFIGALLVGSLGTVYLNNLQDPILLTPGTAETVFSASIQKIFPAFIAGIFLCAILAAAMSTADSQLLVASSAFSHDVFKGVLKKNASPKQVLIVGRITVFVIAAIAFVLALDENSSVFELVKQAWAGFGATFGPLIILALFWRGITLKGAISGLVMGGITVVIWHYLPIWAPNIPSFFKIYEILPGFVINLIFAIGVSLLDKKKDPEMLAQFDEYKKMAD